MIIFIIGVPISVVNGYSHFYFDKYFYGCFFYALAIVDSWLVPLFYGLWKRNAPRTLVQQGLTWSNILLIIISLITLIDLYV